MEKYTKSEDGLKIHYQLSGTKPITIVFVHGWLGNAEWWINQKEFFRDSYTIVQIDLPGHGKSEKGRVEWSSRQYADDIKKVVDDVKSDNIILVGHSMSGAYVLEASLNIERVKLVVLVDTLKNMDKLMDYEQAENLIFKSYKQDFKNAVTHLLPKFLFTDITPNNIRGQLQSEFLEYEADFAVRSIEPLYKMNIKEIARQVQIPVRAINSNFTPTDVNSIRKYIHDFDYSTILETGHYPMLENPNAFNLALNEIINKFLI